MKVVKYNLYKKTQKTLFRKFFVFFFVQFFEPSRCTLYLVLFVNYLSFLVGLTKKSERQSATAYKASVTINTF